MIRRGRLNILALLVLAAALALVSRSGWVTFLPQFVVLYAGDTLWASALYLLLALLKPSAPPFDLFISTLVISLGVEFSQLYQARWINNLRHTFPLGYVLGYGFKWSDLVCYTAGSLVSFTIDKVHTGRRRF